jgi:thiamine kinase-like enzyme
VAPRPHEADGFVVTFWTYYQPLRPDVLSPSDYAAALEQLHAGMRTVEVAAPHFTDRVAEAQRLVDDIDRTPALADDDRALLDGALRHLTKAIQDRGAGEQLLHGEPHPGNVLSTSVGPRFIDLETCCRGPLEFDLAHVPEQVSARYPNLDRQLLRECRTLMLAMIATWRWDRYDSFPDGRQRGIEWTDQLRARLERSEW